MAVFEAADSCLDLLSFQLQTVMRIRFYTCTLVHTSSSQVMMDKGRINRDTLIVLIIILLFGLLTTVCNPGIF